MLQGVVGVAGCCWCCWVLLNVVSVIMGCCCHILPPFSRLTVEEHLWFYARLKGMSSRLVSGEVDR